MATTAQYLTQLEELRQTLISKLTARNLSPANTATLTELVEMVSQIGDKQQWTNNGLLCGELFLPDNVTSIANNAFKLSKVTEVNFPESVTEIGESAFSYCATLNSFTAPSLERLSASSFTNCHGLTNIFLPDSLTYIGQSCFRNCDGLDTISLPATCTFNSHMLSDCSSLTSVTIRPTEKPANGFVGAFCINNCPMLTVINVGTGVKSLDMMCFSNLSSLTTVYLPNTITFINNSSGYGSFNDCENLENVFLADNFNCSINLSTSNNITVESMVNMFNAIKDLTDLDSKTLTLGEVNLQKLTDTQKEIATNKNWVLN